MNLQAFLSPIPMENLHLVVSPRFVDEQGTPLQWEIRAISAEEDEALRRSCMKRSQAASEFDYAHYAGLLAAACTVYPDLNSQSLQEGYRVLGADALLKAMLTAGEYRAFVAQVQELNGFHKNMRQLVDEAKN